MPLLNLVHSLSNFVYLPIDGALGSLGMVYSNQTTSANTELGLKFISAAIALHGTTPFSTVEGQYSSALRR